MTPSRKVSAGALGGAISVVVVWLIGLLITVPATVASAFTTIFIFLVAYFVPNASDDSE